MTSADIDRLVGAALERRTEKKDVVEVEIAMKAADLLVDWAKIFGWFVVVPSVIALAVLAWFGISKVGDVRNILEQANTTLAEARQAGVQADSALKDAQIRLDTTRESAASVDRQLEQLRSVVEANKERIASLDDTVKNIVLRFASNTGLQSSVKNEMSRSVRDFLEYFKRLGYRPGDAERDSVTVTTDTEQPYHVQPDQITYYDLNSSTIFVKRDYATNEFALLHDYSHHVLYQFVSDFADIQSQPQAWGLEGGLASISRQASEIFQSWRLGHSASTS